MLQACPFLFGFRVPSQGPFDAAYQQCSRLNLCATMVKLKMVKNAALDPRRTQWTSFDSGLSCKCHLSENCTLAVRNPGRSETSRLQKLCFGGGARKSLLTPGRGIRCCRYQYPTVLREVQNRPVRSADPNSVGTSNHHFEQPGFCTGHTNTCRAPSQV